MSFALLKSIYCPFCSGDLKSADIGDEGFDVLTCHCSEYPIVAGIPILKRGVVGNSNETAHDVSSMIKNRRYREALLSMIMPPAPASPSLAPAWIRSLPSLKGIRRLKSLAHERGTGRWREQVAGFLTEPRDQVTACDFLDLYYHRSGFKTDDGYDYFALRFGQPRHLVALSFATLIDKPRKPLLDLACGYGHLTWSLTRRAQGQPVIGIDQTFPGLYLAKTIIAPDAEYVCCAADGPLPFPDGFFAATFCSDAFHYFVNKMATMRELKRLTRQDGLIILVWIHNVLWRRPHDGLPLSPEAYQRLVADMPHRLLADNDVLARYLKKQGPSLTCSAGIDELAREPLLSIVVSHRQEVFRDYGSFENWPHGEGRLTLNPLYRVEDRGDSHKDLRLHRRFPSDFYIDDHAQSKEYLPETVEVPSQVLADLGKGQRTPDVEKLVGQFVALGVPRGYS